MWHTSHGKRVLTGAEAAMFRSGLSSLLFYLEDTGDFWRTGVNVFDRLSRPEQLAALEQAASALLIKDVEAPKPTAVSEAAIAAVYRHVEGDLQVEIDNGAEPEIRRVVRTAALQWQVINVPAETSTDNGLWNYVMECLRDRVFSDRDWETAYVDPDAPPGIADEMRSLVGVDGDYYSAAPPDPNPAQLLRIKARLSTLCDDEASDTL